MSTIKKYRLFNIFQYDQEEEFLSKMHTEGYAFVKYNSFLTYHFEKTEPKKVTYKLEYKNTVEDKDEYLQLMDDYGWEYIDTYLDYFYFRKTGDDTSQPFYSDRDSEASHLKRIVTNRFLPIMIAAIFLIVINFDSGPDREAYSNQIIYYLTTAAFGIVSFAAVVVLFGSLWTMAHYFRLKNKIGVDDDHENR